MGPDDNPAPGDRGLSAMDDRSPPEPVDLPEDLIHLVKPELQPGERLLWASHAGAGSPSTVSAPSWAPWIWFLGFASVSLGCLVAVPIATHRAREGPDAVLAILGLLSGVIAFFFVIGFLGNFFSRRAERRKLKGQVYALTDRRGVIWMPEARSAVSVHTFQRGTIKGTDLHRVQYPDGSGDVLFRVSHQQPSGFLGIADVRRVEELVRRFLVIPGQRSNSVDESLLD
jgi:hypothetical protein